jgi:hypothetical protein
MKIKQEEMKKLGWKYLDCGIYIRDENFPHKKINWNSGLKNISSEFKKIIEDLDKTNFNKVLE